MFVSSRSPHQKLLIILGGSAAALSPETKRRRESGFLRNISCLHTSTTFLTTTWASKSTRKKEGGVVQRAEREEGGYRAARRGRPAHEIPRESALLRAGSTREADSGHPCGCACASNFFSCRSERRASLTGRRRRGSSFDPHEGRPSIHMLQHMVSSTLSFLTVLHTQSTVMHETEYGTMCLFYYFGSWTILAVRIGVSSVVSELPASNTSRRW